MSPHDNYLQLLTPKPADRLALSPGKAYFWLGLALLTAYLLQQSTGWQSAWLETWQANPVYKQISGFALFGLILYQWRYSRLRAHGGRLLNAKALLDRHKLLGSIAPLLLYLHAQHLGHGFTALLSLAFVLIIATGLLGVDRFKTHKLWYRPLWLIVHIGASMCLLWLVAYHVYIAYTFGL